MRQPGYYWVKRNTEWFICEYQHGDQIFTPPGYWLWNCDVYVSDDIFLEIDPHPITRPTRTLRADDLTREQAIGLIKIITQDVDHSRIQVLDISPRRIKYLNGAQYEGELVEQILRFDALHPKQFVLLTEWGYDLFNTL